MTAQLIQYAAKRIPNLKHDLRTAGLKYKPEEFVKRTALTAFYMAAGVLIFLGLLLAKFEVLHPLMILAIPIVFLGMFAYMMKLPQVIIARKQKEISKEIIFAGRHLIIELESGIPVYNAFINLSKNYKTIGQYFKQIIDKVNLGTSMEDALSDIIEHAPSNDFRRMLWQILNAMRTGSDVTQSLSLVIDQISREQNIQVSEYGRKLNPLAMFYMIIAVILPSLGITMLIILTSFIDFELNLTILLILAFLLGFVQFMFLAMMRFSRPAIDF